eukprot:CAMPEP_0178411870 /NCGR_PEP_ID=MMETSP0689_2-20121128/21717_1 /TAXON_ID=160604 /ORGANISM="Amphidinium massartii, Strain CS-259" /LENGTH=245 /DNA_ID=CAMNT_0020033089 /DNA_START=21 /DNA_END=758 /DNA_ORIENTATION=+
MLPQSRTWLASSTSRDGTERSTSFEHKADAMASMLDGLRLPTPTSQACIVQQEDAQGSRRGNSAGTKVVEELPDDVPDDEVPEVCARALDRRLRQLRRRSAAALAESASACDSASQTQDVQGKNVCAPSHEADVESAAFWLGRPHMQKSFASSAAQAPAAEASAPLPPCLTKFASPEERQRSEAMSAPKPTFCQRAERSQVGTTQSTPLKRLPSFTALDGGSSQQSKRRASKSSGVCCASADDAM